MQRREINPVDKIMSQPLKLPASVVERDRIIKRREILMVFAENIDVVCSEISELVKDEMKKAGVKLGQFSIYWVGGRVKDKFIKSDSDVDLIFTSTQNASKLFEDGGRYMRILKGVSEIFIKHNLFYKSTEKELIAQTSIDNDEDEVVFYIRKPDGNSKEVSLKYGDYKKFLEEQGGSFNQEEFLARYGEGNYVEMNPKEISISWQVLSHIERYSDDRVPIFDTLLISDPWDESDFLGSRSRIGDYVKLTTVDI